RLERGAASRRRSQADQQRRSPPHRHRLFEPARRSRPLDAGAAGWRDGQADQLTDHDSLSRETVRRRLAENHLKPWQKDMWCIPKVDAEYVARMEDVLDLYAEQPDPPEFCREVQPPASLKGLDIPSRRAVFVPWKPSRRPAFGMETRLFVEEPMLSTELHFASESTVCALPTSIAWHSPG